MPELPDVGVIKQYIDATSLHKKITRAEPGETPSSYLISHRQKDAACPRCNGKVQRIEVSGRGCYICPDCQEK